MPEPFDIKKLLTSPLTGLYWTKVVAIGLGIFTILAVGYTFWRAYGKKAPPTTTQNAEKIENKNYYLQPHFGGCARIIVQGEKK